MSELWLALLPILLAMLISPARTLAVILLLHTPKHGLTAFAYVSGMVSPKQWVFVLTAVAVIFTANLSAFASLVNFFIFTALIQIVDFIITGNSMIRDIDVVEEGH
jgi:hypothetical protein